MDQALKTKVEVKHAYVDRKGATSCVARGRTRAWYVLAVVSKSSVNAIRYVDTQYASVLKRSPGPNVLKNPARLTLQVVIGFSQERTAHASRLQYPVRVFQRLASFGIELASTYLPVCS